MVQDISSGGVGYSVRRVGHNQVGGALEGRPEVYKANRAARRGQGVGEALIFDPVCDAFGDVCGRAGGVVGVPGRFVEVDGVNVGLGYDGHVGVKPKVVTGRGWGKEGDVKWGIGVPGFGEGSGHMGKFRLLVGDEGDVIWALLTDPPSISLRIVTKSLPPPPL